MVGLAKAHGDAEPPAQFGRQRFRRRCGTQVLAAQQSVREQPDDRFASRAAADAKSFGTASIVTSP